MRIAVSGTHYSGKSTLVEALSRELPAYTTVEEPYYLLEDDGYEFAEVPSLEDFESQLQRSLESVEGSGSDVILDRCPIDLLGYLLTHRDADAFRLEDWLPRVRISIENLDLIVFLPIERPDRIEVASSQDKRFRLAVDEKLNEILIENPFELGMNVLKVTGSLHERVQQVLIHLQERGGEMTGSQRPGQLDTHRTGQSGRCRDSEQTRNKRTPGR
ncbi:MAG: ATP-binding protein [Acidobacteriia bacterium]|nr:ATP-binding protein [Terriglobia bacterium]